MDGWMVGWTGGSGHLIADLWLWPLFWPLVWLFASLLLLVLFARSLSSLLGIAVSFFCCFLWAEGEGTVFGQLW